MLPAARLAMLPAAAVLAVLVVVAMVVVSLQWWVGHSGENEQTKVAECK
jgi:hypothetical protein